MRNINYMGFSGTPSICGYGSTQVGNTVIMVFEHKHVGTSPQNLIEALTTANYNADFPNVEPSNIRVFEADFSGTGLFKYQEVTFSVISSNASTSMLDKIRDLLGSKPPVQWFFSSPNWHPLTDGDQQWLDGLIARGEI